MGMVLILVVLIAAGVAGYAYLRRRGAGTATRVPWELEPREEDAVDIASRRYAAGEITREEFERIRRDLGQDRGA